jgi:activating signal cointegrator 1
VTAVEGLRTLSLWQPYASLVACGAKTWETRGQRTHYRGRIGIASTASTPAAVRRSLRDSSARRGGGRYLFREHLGDYSLEGESHGVVRALPQGVLLATAELADCVPMLGHEDPSPTGGSVRIDPPFLWWSDIDGDVEHIDDELPFGVWEPGRWAWRLEDVKPTTERCPWCWGDGGFREDSMALYGVAGGEDWSYPCQICNPGGARTEPLGEGAYGCAPVPVKGKQGLWTWRP